MNAFTSRNPCDGTEYATFPAHTAAELSERLSTCHAAAQTMRLASFADRATWLKNAAVILRNRADEFAVIMAEEVGKPLAQGKGEATKCGWVCDHYAEHGETYLSAETFEIETSQVSVEYAPLGVVLAVMPWNFPFWQLFRCAAPIIMGGNTIFMKHAANVPRCALAIETIFRDAGFPKGAVTNVFAGHDAIPTLLESPMVAGVTLTGSTRAGKAVAADAGRHLKPCVLELGGSDPYIIFDDADLDTAIAACITGRLQNSGQSCIATKRILVQRAVADDFQERLLDVVRTKTVGDPTLEPTDVGPLARADLADELRRQVSESLAAGAELVYQSDAPDGECFVPISILGNVRRGMPAWDEELFGPVFALCEFDTIGDAIQLANDSCYGLGAAVFTADTEKATHVSNRLACGNVAINDMVKSDPRYPFGGIKESGYGRELGKQGIRAFMSVKTTCAAK